MASPNNCTSWPSGKREQMGCGTTCDCVGMTQNLHPWNWVVSTSRLISEGQVGLNDLDAYTWNVCDYYAVEKHNLAVERKERAERVASLLGVKNG